MSPHGKSCQKISSVLEGGMTGWNFSSARCGVQLHMFLVPAWFCVKRTYSIFSCGQYMTLRKYSSHPSVVVYSFEIKLKLGQQIGGVRGLLIANHLEKSRFIFKV
jgi:hypothetical protein